MVRGNARTCGLEEHSIAVMAFLVEDERRTLVRAAQVAAMAAPAVGIINFFARASIRRQYGIDTLTAAVGRNALHHGSDRGAAVPPNVKRLGPKLPEDAARQEMALDVEGVLDGGVDRQEALG